MILFIFFFSNLPFSFTLKDAKHRFRKHTPIILHSVTHDALGCVGKKNKNKKQNRKDK